MKDRSNFTMGPSGGPRKIIRSKIVKTNHGENRKQWAAGIDRMIAYRKKQRRNQEDKAKEQKIINNQTYESIHFVDTARKDLWYKGWACILDGILNIGRRLSIIHIAKKYGVEYFSLNKGVYTNNPDRIRL